ncbi:MAG: PEP-CTERM sorting domain-containing protein [Planctomycetes bacterium]|nr:PEP-CTERM sorting domain-containing protein [Planctomycetota bacterium]
MRKLLSFNLLIACLALPACSDGSRAIVATNDGPEAPINEPDTGAFNPPGSTGTGSEPTGGNPSGSGASGSGITPEPGEPGEGGNGAGTAGGSLPGGTTGGGNGGTGGNPSNGGSTVGNEGSANGQPVPEPGTLLLFGTGMAGIGASLLRRRRKREPTA